MASFSLRSPRIAFQQIRGLSSSTHSLSSGQVATLRRAKERQGWGVDNLVSESDDFFVYPRETHGNTYLVNWAINQNKICPTGDAYRNLHLRGLVMLAKGKVDGQKALHVETNSVPSSQFRALATQSEELQGLLRETRRFLSQVPELFMHDGELISDSARALPIRVYADNAASALWCHHRLFRIPPYPDPRKFAPSITVYITSNPGRPSTVAYDPEAGSLILNNVSSTETLEEALLKIVGHKHPDIAVDGNFSSLLSGSVFSPNPGHRDLILNLPGKKLASLEPESLFSAHSTLWSTAGLSRVFEGSSLATTIPTAKYDLVTSQQITRPWAQRPLPTIDHPSRLIFLGGNQKGIQVSPLPADRLSTLTNSHSPILADILKIRSIPCFLLSITPTTTWSQIATALQAPAETKKEAKK